MMRAFFHKHRRILPLLGAFIVFITYVTHDYVKDGFKDRQSRIEAARDQFELRANFADIYSIIRNQPDAQYDSFRKYGFWVLAAADNNLANQRSWDEMNRTTTALAKLLQSFPAPDTEEVNRLQQFQRKMGDTLVQGIVSPTDMAETGRQMDIANQHLYELSSEMGQLRVEVDKQLDAGLANAARKYNWSNVASIAFFTAGWILATFGKLKETTEE